MKRSRIAGVAAIIVVSLMLAGCTKAADAPLPYREPAAMTQREALALFEELYPKAEAVLKQLRVNGGVQPGGKQITVDGILWQQVLDYPNVEAFQQALEEVFSWQMDLQYVYFTSYNGSEPRFKDIDGALYVNYNRHGGGEDIGKPYQMDTLRVVVLEERRIEFEVTPDVTEVKDSSRVFELQKAEDGTWRFSEYEKYIPAKPSKP